MPASYGNIALFGTAVTFEGDDLPRESQRNSFFGLSGVESLDGGDRGRMTIVRGLLYGSGAAGLADALSTLRSYKDGVARDLVDTLGVVWPEVLLESVRTVGRIYQSPAGVLFQRYEARFFHLP